LAQIIHPPLTRLSEEESLFYATVRKFAEETIAPKSGYDDVQQFADGLGEAAFRARLMGIEAPEEFLARLAAS